MVSPSTAKTYQYFVRHALRTVRLPPPLSLISFPCQANNFRAILKVCVLAPISSLNNTIHLRSGKLRLYGNIKDFPEDKEGVFLQRNMHMEITIPQI